MAAWKCVTSARGLGAVPEDWDGQISSDLEL